VEEHDDLVGAVLRRQGGRPDEVDEQGADLAHLPAEADRIGLVDRLVDGDPLEAALALAGELAAMSRPALEAVVRTVDAAFDRPLPEGIRFEADEENALFAHGEAREGLRAFVARRRPEFGA
ncbi:enoyl-CoA hydratase-related protein, partial [Patulibacter sp. S7RM1-6]